MLFISIITMKMKPRRSTLALWNWRSIPVPRVYSIFALNTTVTKWHNIQHHQLLKEGLAVSRT